jgi:hypothetical protein
MESVFSFKTSANFFLTSQRHNPDGSHLFINRAKAKISGNVL